MTREKRGEGPRVRVALDTPLPKWLNFLRNCDNKKDLFQMIANAVEGIQTEGVAIYSTQGTGVVTNCGRLDFTGLAPCNHEEADTRLFVHVADAVRGGLTRVAVQSCDTDVVVLACSCFVQLPELKELWIVHTVSKKYPFIAIHELCETLGTLRSASS